MNVLMRAHSALHSASRHRFLFQFFVTFVCLLISQFMVTFAYCSHIQI